jgi:hypothetical protein
MRICFLLSIVLFYGAVSFVTAQETRPCLNLSKRDLQSERAALEQRKKIEAMLPAWARGRLEDASRKVAVRLARSKEPVDANNVVNEELSRHFTNLTGPQNEILRFYVATSVTRSLPPHSGKQTARDTRDSISEMGEQDMLILQCMMEKKGQLETMISNTMKAASEASRSAIQAIKAS